MGYTQKLGLLAQSVFQDSSLNVGIGAAPSGTYKFEVTGTGKVSGNLTVSNITISKGTGTGVDNISVGDGLGNNTTGSNNTVIGSFSLINNISGSNNTAIGYHTLRYNTTGNSNTALGFFALQNMTTGQGNTVVGGNAGGLIITGSNNTIVGAYAGTTALSNNIVLADGASNIRFRFDGTNTFLSGSVAIGSTTSPSYTLDVSGTLRNTTSAYFATTSGSVGIGTTSPAYPLDVKVATNRHWAISASSTGFASFRAGDDGYNNFNRGEIDALPLLLNSQSGGNVGIGTTSPNYTAANRTVLDINGTQESLLAFSTGGAAKGYIYHNASTSIYWTEGNRNMEFGLAGTGYMGFGTNNAERMRITSAGDILVGLTSSTYSTTNRRSIVANGTTTALFGLVVNNVNKGYFYSDGTNINLMSEDASGAMAFGTNNNVRMSILANGQMNPGADNSYGFGGSGIRWAVIWAANGTIQTSDKREKKDIKESDLGLNFISKLNPVSFKWIVGHNEVSTKKVIDVDGSEKTEEVITPREGKRKHYGLIAQEVKEALNGIDFGGFIEDEETGIMGLRYDQFVPLLIKAIQELSAQNQDLKSRLDKAGL